MGLPTTEDAIRTAEAELGRQLPPGLRDRLLRNNGGEIFGHPQPAAELLGVGVLGLVATLGIYFYERRNTELYAASAARARQLERELGMPSGQLVSTSSAWRSSTVRRSRGGATSLAGA